MSRLIILFGSYIELKDSFIWLGGQVMLVVAGSERLLILCKSQFLEM